MHIASLTRALVEERHTVNCVSSCNDLPLVRPRSLSEHHLLRLRSYITFLLEYFLLLSCRRGVIGEVLVFHRRLRIRLSCRLSSDQMANSSWLWLRDCWIIFIWADILPLTNLLLTAVCCVLIYSCLSSSSPLLLAHSELICLLTKQ